jgi:membrane-bound metal-dependent hydrolase YbcI (DUF457 family)
MDPVTHALSGAVLARAVVPQYGDERLARTARWAVILGAIFPDIDVIANPFDPDHFATIRIHRSVTHSFVCLPVWACLFALLAGWYCRRRGIAAPGRGVLGVLFGLGVGLHVVFDCITSFGTMAWSPISWTRVQWDWTFIIDLTLTGVLLFFLLLSWVAERTEERTRRAAWMLVQMGALAGLYALGSYALQQATPVWLAAVVLVLSALPLGVTLAGGRLPMTARSWCRVGVLAAAAYLGTNAWAHAQALERVRNYAAAEHLSAVEAAAIPLPPNLTLWQGFLRTADSIHQWTISLTAPPAAPLAASVAPAVSGEACPPALWTLPQVRAWMRFARFPVVVCGHAPGGEAAQFTDLRFERPALRGAGRERPIPFTWRITINDGGKVIAEGWVIR